MRLLSRAPLRGKSILKTGLADFGVPLPGAHPCTDPVTRSCTFHRQNPLRLDIVEILPPPVRVAVLVQFVQEHEGVSTILVTHDMREAVTMASTLVILYQGRVAQAGPTADVLKNPSGDYVAALLKGQLE